METHLNRRPKRPLVGQGAPDDPARRRQARQAQYKEPTFRDQPHARARGRAGEDRAAEWLESRGYVVVARNVVNKAGEIDVVARDGDVLCFIEVKARTTRTYGPAVEAVTVAKQRRLARASALYLAFHPTDAPCRFDVLGMDLTQQGWRFTLIRDAFQVPSGSYGRRS